MAAPNLPPLIGGSPAFAQALDQVSRIAPLDRPVLVIGERGTGKELIAARLHFLSRRWDRAFVQVNCAALSEDLLDSELFGHEVGAFTGATRRHIGRFERADGGTLFLDEIATASQRVQEKILRVIEYGTYERLGASETREVDVRLIAATNIDLPGAVQAGTFRADLLDRLAFDVVTLPPLRARLDDIEPLAEAFGTRMARDLGADAFPGFTRAALGRLEAHAWPGNVRELKNAVERAVYRADGLDRPIDRIVLDPFDSPHRPGLGPRPAPPSDPVPPDPVPSAPGDRAPFRPADPTPAVGAPAGGDPPADFKAAVARYETGLLRRALAAHRGNQTRAAQALALTYHQFRGLLRKHKLLEGQQ